MSRLPDSQILQWRKSSHSGNQGGNCVEVAHLPDGGVAVRDSKDRGGQTLVFTAAEWAAFVAGVRDGEFEAPNPAGM